MRGRGAAIGGGAPSASRARVGVVWFFSTALVVRSVAGHGSAREACVGVLKEADKAPEGSRAYEVYRQCHLQRPDGGFLSDGSAREDCAQFGRLWRMASHYGNPKSGEFCGMIASFRGADVTADPRVVDHRACVAALPRILNSSSVEAAAEAACMQVKPNITKVKVACHRYASVLGKAVGSGLLDAPRLCDRVVAGNATAGFDQDHFVYSCEQYAANLAVRHADGESTRELGIEASENCEKHLPPVDKPFCMEYTRQALAGHHSRTHFAEICEEQYHKMRDPDYGKRNFTKPMTSGPLANDTQTKAKAPVSQEPKSAGPTDKATMKGEVADEGGKPKTIEMFHHPHHLKAANRKAPEQQPLDGMLRSTSSKHRRHHASPSVAVAHGSSAAAAHQSSVEKPAAGGGYMKFLKGWVKPKQSLVAESEEVGEGGEAGILQGFLSQDDSSSGDDLAVLSTNAGSSDPQATSDAPEAPVQDADPSEDATALLSEAAPDGSSDESSDDSSAKLLSEAATSLDDPDA